MLKRNIIPTFLGNGYVVILQFALVPLLLKYLGTEAYGLVGIYITLLAAINALDMGLSPALSRELARLSALPNSQNLMRSTVTTLECIYIGIVLLIAIMLWFSSAWIAKYWLNNSSLPAETISTCLQIMGMQCACQMLTNFYNSGLVGMQHMVRANSVLVLNHSLRAVAGVVLLLFVSQDIQLYFLSQFLCTLVGLLMTAFSLYNVLPAISLIKQSAPRMIEYIKHRFDIDRFRACRHFAGGMMVISLCASLIMQIDKVIISKLVTLEQFGFYIVALNIALTIAGAAGVVSKSVLPRLTQLAAVTDTESIKLLYLKSSALVGWLVMPVASILILFNQSFLTLYLRDVNVAHSVSDVFVLLMVGYSLHSLVSIPYALSLAYGWTRYGINISVMAIVFMTPVTICATLKFGIVGAATAWIVQCIIYLSFPMKYLHSILLKGQLMLFYKSIGIQLIILLLSCLAYFLLIR